MVGFPLYFEQKLWTLKSILSCCWISTLNQKKLHSNLAYLSNHPLDSRVNNFKHQLLVEEEIASFKTSVENLNTPYLKLILS